MIKDVNILVVDDNLENLKVVCSLLKEKKYQIALAENGERALKILEEIKIDLILLDIMMPEMDGFEVCRLIKKNPETENIPIIFLTAKSETGEIVKGFQAGGVDYITKPFVKEELFARVNNHIQLKQVRDMLRKSADERLKSRDMFMRTMLDLSKMIDTDK
jgi:two-component system, sensor histidine kinase and response regulator